MFENWHNVELNCQGVQEMVRRKQSGNPVDFFDKTFAEYQEGFSANGEQKRKKDTKFLKKNQERVGLA